MSCRVNAKKEKVRGSLISNDIFVYVMRARLANLRETLCVGCNTAVHTVWYRVQRTNLDTSLS